MLEYAGLLLLGFMLEAFIGLMSYVYQVSGHQNSDKQ